MKDISIKLMPYERIKSIGIKNILSDLKKNTIVVVDAKLSPKEEADLIQETMEEVSDSFSGIEIGSFDVSDEEDAGFFSQMRGRLAEFLLGKKRGLTVIGPAEMIKKIKKDPQELMFYLK
ncbi:MAG: DUF2073 domain-containing protein [Candidatus Aenigmarchaeota archaeon]|nr:DUF2073 domain-containing protein [Candidatus Aenigmarchaeota archaeon]